MTGSCFLHWWFCTICQPYGWSWSFGPQDERSWQRQHHRNIPNIFGLCLRPFGPSGWCGQLPINSILEYFSYDITGSDGNAPNSLSCTDLAIPALDCSAIYYGLPGSPNGGGYVPRTKLTFRAAIFSKALSKGNDRPFLREDFSSVEIWVQNQRYAIYLVPI